MKEEENQVLFYEILDYVDEFKFREENRRTSAIGFLDYLLEIIGSFDWEDLKFFFHHITEKAQDVIEKEDPKPAAPVQTKEKEYVKSEVYYGVQIMGLGRLLKSGDSAFKGLNVHHVKGESSNIYRYIYGKYDTIDKAKEALPLVRKKFPEAFPVQVIGTEVKRVK